MAFRINYSEEKNQLLKATRGVCFEDAISAIKEGYLLADLHHVNPEYSHQKIYVILIAKYVYAVPYVENKEKKEIFLKTMFPSRVLMKKYGRKGAK